MSSTTNLRDLHHTQDYALRSMANTPGRHFAAFIISARQEVERHLPPAPRHGLPPNAQEAAAKADYLAALEANILETAAVLTWLQAAFNNTERDELKAAHGEALINLSYQLAKKHPVLSKWATRHKAAVAAYDAANAAGREAQQQAWEAEEPARVIAAAEAEGARLELSPSGELQFHGNLKAETMTLLRKHHGANTK
jgi:hypothetical protein